MGFVLHLWARVGDQKSHFENFTKMCDFQCDISALVQNVLWLLTQFWNILHHLPPIPNPTHKKFLYLTKYFCMLCLVRHFDKYWMGKESKRNQFKSVGGPWAYFYSTHALIGVGTDNTHRFNWAEWQKHFEVAPQTLPSSQLTSFNNQQGWKYVHISTCDSQKAWFQPWKNYHFFVFVSTFCPVMYSECLYHFWGAYRLGQCFKGWISMFLVA